MSSKSSGRLTHSDADVELLLKRIEEQNDLIGRLQSKFRDVTHAYKSLKAENQALEITIKSLKSKNSEQQAAAAATASKPASASSSRTDLRETTSENEAEIRRATEKNTSSTNEEKIAALTANIQVVLENKARMEASYQAEKKKLRAEIDELKSKFESLKQESQKQNESSETRIKELKSNLKQSQADRESLTAELNNLIRVKQSEQDSRVLSVQEENQSVLTALRIENNELKMRIKNLNKQFENKCEELVQAENEYKKLKLSHEEQLKSDETELARLRAQLRDQTQTHESRVRDLESRIAQLCSLVANYESGGVNGGNDVGGGEYLMTKHSVSPPRFVSPVKAKTIEKQMAELNLKSSDKMDFDSAVEQISQLKSYVESTARELNINFNFNEIWLQSGEFNAKLEKDKQKEIERENEKLKDENRHLKEEYEKFKIRTNYLIKSAKHKEANNQEAMSSELQQQQQQQQQIGKLKEEIETLKRRLHQMRQEKEEEARRESEIHEREISELRLELRTQFEKMENERLKCVGDVELELRKQRERTLRLLGEKEAEIEQLNQQLRMRALIKPSTPSTRNLAVHPAAVAAIPNDDSSLESNNSSLGEANGGDHELEQQQVAASASSSNQMIFEPGAMDEGVMGGVGANNYMLYYNQQLAYKDSELNKLRVAKSELEYKLKQIEDEHSVDVERMQAQIGLLKDEIERCKLNDARVDLNRENLEYIKNVVFNYMTTRDQNVRASMATAITHILKFSKSEKMKLTQLNSASGSSGNSSPTTASSVAVPNSSSSLTGRFL